MSFPRNGFHWQPRWRSRRRIRRRILTPPLWVEELERRRVLSQVTWTGDGDGKSWTDGSIWSDDAIPNSADDVAINVSSNPTIQIASGTRAIHSLTGTDPLSIAGNSLAVAANSTMSGGLAMTGGSLVASGSGFRDVHHLVRSLLDEPQQVEGRARMPEGGRRGTSVERRSFQDSVANLDLSVRPVLFA